MLLSMSVVLSTIARILSVSPGYASFQEFGRGTRVTLVASEIRDGSSEGLSHCVNIFSYISTPY